MHTFTLQFLKSALVHESFEIYKELLVSIKSLPEGFSGFLKHVNLKIHMFHRKFFIKGFLMSSLSPLVNLFSRN